MKESNKTIIEHLVLSAIASVVLLFTLGAGIAGGLQALFDSEVVGVVVFILFVILAVYLNFIIWKDEISRWKKEDFD